METAQFLFKVSFFLLISSKVGIKFEVKVTGINLFDSKQLRY